MQKCRCSSTIFVLKQFMKFTCMAVLVGSVNAVNISPTDSGSLTLKALPVSKGSPNAA